MEAGWVLRWTSCNRWMPTCVYNCVVFRQAWPRNNCRLRRSAPLARRDICLSYHAVPDNMRRLDQFVSEVSKLWMHQLRRRSQRGPSRWNWDRMNRMLPRYLPTPRILHPYPKDRFRARLKAGAV
jgi:hypothetical protein